jgi:hypothetical protein
MLGVAQHPLPSGGGIKDGGKDRKEGFRMKKTNWIRNNRLCRLLGLLALVVMVGLAFGACKNDSMDVNNWPDWPAALKDVTAGTVTLTATTGDAKKFILTCWDAVARAGSSYQVVMRKKGNKTWSPASAYGISTIPTSGFAANPADGTPMTSGTYNTDK